MGFAAKKDHQSELVLPADPSDTNPGLARGVHAMRSNPSPPKPARCRLGERLAYFRDLLRELIVRDLKIRYKRSYLGIAWSLVTPIAQVLIFSFLFKRVLPLNIPNYSAFLFAGVLSWSWFVTSLSSAAGAVVGNPGLVRRPGFPVAVLPMLTVATSGVHFVLALPLLLLVTVLGGGALGSALVALPLLIAVQFFFSLSLAYLIAASNVRFRDTQHLVALLAMVAFYLTPVFYSARMVPEEYQFLYSVNPMAIILQAYRDVVIQNTWPDFNAILLVSALSALIFAGAYWFFNRMSVRFAEEL
jgi:lipopolysaccharide transport system permease protein